MNPNKWPAESFVGRMIEVWALLGGLLLLAVVFVNVASIVGAATIGKPFPGDFELTEIGVAVSAFAFLPYCQLTGAHVSADIFTSRLSRFWTALLGLLAAGVGFVFALVLLWRMSAGMIDQKTYGYTTAILQFPHWLAYLPILFSLALWAMAAAVSLKMAWKKMRSHG